MRNAMGIKNCEILAKIRESILGGIFIVGASCHNPAGANAVTLATFVGLRAAISSEIQPPREFPATCILSTL